MKRVFVAGLSAVVLFLGAQSVQAEGTGEKGYRLFYVFSPDQAEQRLRALLLERVSRSSQDGLQVVGLARTSGPADELEAFRQSQGLSYPLFAASSWQQADAPAGLEEHLEPGPDYALLVDCSGQLVNAGSGEQLVRILGRFAAVAEVSTDVDESTWGKVKELFR